MKYEFGFILKQIVLVGVGIVVSVNSISYFSDFRIHAVAIIAFFGMLMVLLGLVKKEDVLKLLKKG